MQDLNRLTQFMTYLCICIIILAAAGPGASAGQQNASVIKKNDVVHINYTCTAENGEVVITTEPEVAKDKHQAKSMAFWDQSNYKDVKITAGTEAFAMRQGDLKLFDLEIWDRFSQAVIGKKKGQSFDLQMQAQLPEKIEDSIRYHLDLKTRKVPRVQKMSLYAYDRSMGKAPAVGDTWQDDNGVPYARVVSFDDKEVTYELVTEDGYKAPTRWGTGTSRRSGDQMLLTIDAKVGTLVRWNRLLGKIIEVNDTHIKVDYGHPFGGEKITCRVKVSDNNEKAEEKK